MNEINKDYSKENNNICNNDKVENDGDNDKIDNVDDGNYQLEMIVRYLDEDVIYKVELT